MSFSITCDCGQVQIELPEAPRRLTRCPCDFCRRSGALWAYYPKQDPAISGRTDTYQRGQKRLDFHRCADCGGLTHWRAVTVEWNNTGINMAQADPGMLAGIPVGPPQ